MVCIVSCSEFSFYSFIISLIHYIIVYVLCYSGDLVLSPPWRSSGLWRDSQALLPLASSLSMRFVLLAFLCPLSLTPRKTLCILGAANIYRRFSRMEQGNPIEIPSADPRNGVCCNPSPALCVRGVWEKGLGFSLLFWCILILIETRYWA